MKTAAILHSKLVEHIAGTYYDPAIPPGKVVAEIAIWDGRIVLGISCHDDKKPDLCVGGDVVSGELLDPLVNRLLEDKVPFTVRKGACTIRWSVMPVEEAAQITATATP